MADRIEVQRPAPAGRLPRDLVPGLVLLAFCGWVYWLSLSIPLAPAALAQNVQPATFPRGVVGVIVALTALMMVLGLGRQEKARRAPKAVVLVTAALMVAFVVAFGMLGPVAAMMLFCLGMPVIWGAKVSGGLVAYALLFPLAVYMLFGVALDVYFPRGLLENHLDALF
jgi:hypothetical protein